MQTMCTSADHFLCGGGWWLNKFGMTVNQEIICQPIPILFLAFESPGKSSGGSEEFMSDHSGIL